jgi:hypothetical protein
MHSLTEERSDRNQSVSYHFDNSVVVTGAGRQTKHDRNLDLGRQASMSQDRRSSASKTSHNLAGFQASITTMIGPITTWTNIQARSEANCPLISVTLAL